MESAPRWNGLHKTSPSRQTCSRYLGCLQSNGLRILHVFPIDLQITKSPGGILHLLLIAPKDIRKDTLLLGKCTTNCPRSSSCVDDSIVTEVNWQLHFYVNTIEYEINYSNSLLE